MKENKNSSTINLGKCEDTLKYIYNISNQSNLYMLKIDREQKGKNYPIIEYEVFYPLENGKIKFLNLSYCKTSDIEISIPINITGPFDKKKYNPKSSYYNNICSKTNSNSNVDIPLKDRRNEFIKNNISLCEANCEFTDYNINNFIKNRINLKYIKENKEMIIQKDEMNIAFTSTYIQKLNEDSNTTTINLGKCEKDLKVIYNIPPEKHL